jgi:hypothetical protein
VWWQLQFTPPLIPGTWIAHLADRLEVNFDKEGGLPMTQDPFGNLQEWGSVMERLAELKCSGCLAECQRGIIRILRFRGNWRLREEVLNQLGQIPNPTEELIETVCGIVLDESVYYEIRVLASKVLPRLIHNRQKVTGSRSCPKTESIISSLRASMETIHPPVFHNALGQCLQLLV